MFWALLISVWPPVEVCFLRIFIRKLRKIFIKLSPEKQKTQMDNKTCKCTPLNPRPFTITIQMERCANSTSIEENVWPILMGPHSYACVRERGCCNKLLRRPYCLKWEPTTCCINKYMRRERCVQGADVNGEGGKRLINRWGNDLFVMRCVNSCKWAFDLFFMQGDSSSLIGESLNWSMKEYKARLINIF